MRAVTAALAVGAIVAVQACAQPAPAPAQSEPTAVGEATTVMVRGWVAAVDKVNRTVTLRGPRGGTVTLDVKDPQKLDAVQVGDPVLASYVEALAVQVKKAGAAAPGVSVQESLVTSKPGETPGGAVGREVVVTAMLTAVDKSAQTVTVKNPQGNIETIKVKDPRSLAGVEAGNMVELTYTQALAITLERSPQ
jgi:hypothetical protein